MKQAFSTKWKSSRRPSKQRKYRHQAPRHIKQKLLSAHLSKDLRKKYGKRSFSVVKGDTVKVVRGQFKGRQNKVERVNYSQDRVYITGIERAKKDGSKSLQPVNPSNLIITELNLDDKKRKAAIERKSAKTTKETKKETKSESKSAPTKEKSQQSGSKEENQNA